MRTFLHKTFDSFIGINFTIGFFTAFWVILSLIFDLPVITEKNIIFIVLFSAVPWLTNFIFSYSSHLYIKGILHGVVWFVISIIIFNLMYNIAIDAMLLLLFALIFSGIYALFLWLFSCLSAKFNIPVRYVSEFLFKLVMTMKK